MTQRPAPSPSIVDRAEQFIWLSARLLEQHRFAYHFLGGEADAVETALAPYARPDGGYGYALEADVRGPASQPLHAGTALLVLDEIGRCDAAHTARLLGHLPTLTTPDGGLPAIHPGGARYPSAAVLPMRSDPPGALLSTGVIAGTLHRNGITHPWLDEATEFCWAAVDSLETSHPYEVEAAVTFLDGVTDRERAAKSADRLGQLVREQRLVVTDPARPEEFPVSSSYAPGEYHYVYDVARTPDSLARAWFSDREVTDALDHLTAVQQDDGGWPVLWRVWAPGTLAEWRPIVTLNAVRTLRAYGRL
jgi:hypothetical protein